jgi:HTH-type transcriptional regulator / antitoxin HigA
MEKKLIKVERDYEWALRRVEQLWASPKGSPESDELNVLVTLIEADENEHYPIDLLFDSIRKPPIRISTCQ